MSRFTRCDICGTECSVKTLQVHINIIDYDTENDDYKYEDLDLCPECTKKLQDFIYILRKYPNNYVIHVNEEGDSNAD